MLSAGMLTSLASAMMVRNRGLLPGSPPPLRAATVSSLMMRVKILPRLASAAPFLCLMVCHLEWPDMVCSLSTRGRSGPKILALCRQNEPDVSARVPFASSVVTEDRIDAKARAFDALQHCFHRQGPERQRKFPFDPARAAPFDEA